VRLIAFTSRLWMGQGGSRLQMSRSTVRNTHSLPLNFPLLPECARVELMTAGTSSHTGFHHESHHTAPVFETIAPLHDQLDAFYFTEMPDLDPFEMFDPGLDLGDIDAFIEGNLGLGNNLASFT
jgi:hypothetical protein